MSFRTRLLTVVTTDATPTELFNDGDVAAAYLVFLRAFVSAGITRTDYRTLIIAAQSYATSEASKLITSDEVANDGTVGSATWAAAMIRNGSDEVALQVTGAASTTITWQAQIIRIDT